MTGDAAQLGQGVNRRSTPETVLSLLRRVCDDVLRHRVADYQDAAARSVLELTGDLLGRRLGGPAFAPEQISFFHGATEAISVASAYAAHLDLVPVLPLPNYYAFEHSLGRHGAVPPVFYSALGRTSRTLGASVPRFLVDVAPNGVLGSLFRRPDGGTVGPGGRRMVDLPFSFPRFSPALSTALAERAAGPVPTLLCVTSSKDLSVPGLRAALVATSDPGFVGFAAADRFERGYAAHAMVGPVVACHLGLVLLAESGGALDPWLRMRFAAHRIPFLAPAEVAGFIEEIADMRAHFERNLEIVHASGLFEPQAVEERPAAGYSTFCWLRAEFESSAHFTRWVHDLGLAGMKVNPNYLFGGTPESWSRLHPGCYGIRLNLSAPTDELRRDLARLAGSLSHRRPPTGQRRQPTGSSDRQEVSPT